VTTNSLSKHYGILTAAERLSLMMAAGVRGDDVEHARLADAAPRVTRRVPHTFGRALALLDVFNHHRMERLNLAALFFKAAALADFFKTAALADASKGGLTEQLRNAVRMYGYLVKANAEGWARFCAAEQLDPTLFEDVSPGGDTLECAAREAGAVGFTEDEARACVRKDGSFAPDNLKTAALIAEGLHETFTFLLKKWE
jgi:hypothetical protein